MLNWKLEAKKNLQRASKARDEEKVLMDLARRQSVIGECMNILKDAYIMRVDRAEFLKLAYNALEMHKLMEKLK